MCEYCDSKFVKELQMSKPLFTGYCEAVDRNILIGIEESEIRIYNDEDVGFTFIPVNYCPMCGRKLN